MNSHYLKITWLAAGTIAMLASGACTNTARGVVRDTKHNTEKVGRGVEHVGEKIQDSTR